MTFQSQPIMRLLVSVLDIKYSFKLCRNVGCYCESFGAETVHNEILAVLEIKLIETILPSRSLLEFSIDADELREGLTRIHTPLL